LKTVIGVVGSRREARLKLMHILGNKLANKGYNVALVFQDDYNSIRDSNVFLVVDVVSSSTFIRVNSKLSLNDIKGFIPGKWCLVLVEGYKAAPHVVVASSEADVNGADARSIAIVPLSDDIKHLAAPQMSKIVDINEALKAIHEVMLGDIMKLLALENCGECGFNNCRALAEAIARGEEDPVKCIKRRESVKLVVDGELVPLNQFTSKMFVQVLKGLLSILKGVPKGPKKIFLEADLH